MPTIDQLKYLSERRLEAAEALIESDIHDIAYQDSGYVIEFGLKAAICKKLEVNEYPQEQKFYTHRYDDLIKLAGLDNELADKKAVDREFMKNWSISTKWSVHLRYQPIGKDVVSVTNAYINAIKSETGGVLPWIKVHW